MPANYETGATVVNERLGRSTPWHGLGTYVESTMTTDEALRAGELDWNVKLVPTYIRDRVGFMTQVKDSFAVVRDSDNRILAPHVGRLYTPFQNRSVMEFGDLVVDSFGAHWDTVGSLRNGRLVFASLELSDVIETITPAGLDDEAFQAYLLLSNTHDGSRAFRAAVTLVRTVCTNTEAMALATAKTSWSLRHTSSLDERLEDARTSLKLVTVYAQEYAETMEKMMDIEASLADIDALIDSVIPIDEGQRNSVKLTQERDDLRSHILSTPTVRPELRQTNFGVFQSVSEYFEHEKDFRLRKSTPKAEGKLLSTLFGGPIETARRTAFAALAPA
jgi:phage/plasmid-like protein (TIGR03299 family)